MKKNIIIVVSAVIVLIIGISILNLVNNEGENKNTDINGGDQEKVSSFIGTVEEVGNNSLIVKPMEYEPIINSVDKISVTTNLAFKVGDKVYVKYTGEVMKSYPAQIHTLEVKEYLVNSSKDGYKELNKLPAEYTLDEAISDGYFVITGARVYGENQYEEIMKNFKDKIPSFMRLVQPTVEGDVIITDIEITSDNKIKIVSDSTRDKFSNQEDRTYKEYVFDNIAAFTDSTGMHWYAFNGDKMTNEKQNTSDSYYLARIN